jgi:hypothetical protein
MRRIGLSLVIALVPTLQAQVPTISRKLTIGCESCSGPEQFGSIWDVSVSASGEVLVTNKEAPMLRRFDANGKSSWTGGPKGKGPGEFELPIRGALTSAGIVVIDMTNSRVTEIGPSGQVGAMVPLTSMATTSGVDRRGEMVVGYDDMGRSFRVMAKPAGATELRLLARFPGSFRNKSVALAPDGGAAVALDGQKYEIQRVGADGSALPPIIRDIPRPQRSAVEEAEFRQRLNRDLGAMAAEMKSQGKGEMVAPPTIPAGERGFKPHMTVDGLRYDDAGRLWVHTMRGDETKTVLDVFAAGGDFLGSVTLPMRIAHFALAGSYLATAGENEDGIPVVTVWTVK